MCQLDDDFRLCSCDGERLTNPDWTLERLNPDLPPLHLRGRVMMHRFDRTDRALQATVLAGLARGCFDFDYTPLSGDVLSLSLSGRRLRFRHDGGEWSIDESTHLASWRAQMVTLNSGKIA
jgi:hypothetical protein